VLTLRGAATIAGGGAVRVVLPIFVHTSSDPSFVDLVVRGEDPPLLFPSSRVDSGHLVAPVYYHGPQSISGPGRYLGSTRRTCRSVCLAGGKWHQRTWYFTENTAIRVDRYCMNLTINLTYENNGPLCRPQDRIGYPPKSRACAEEHFGQKHRHQSASMVRRSLHPSRPTEIRVTHSYSSAMPSRSATTIDI